MKKLLLIVNFFAFYCHASDFHVILNKDDRSPQDSNSSSELDDWFKSEVLDHIFAEQHNTASENSAAHDWPRKIGKVILQNEIDDLCATQNNSKKRSFNNGSFDYSKLNVKNLSLEEIMNDIKEQGENKKRLTNDPKYNNYCEWLEKEEIRRNKKNKKK